MPTFNVLVIDVRQLTLNPKDLLLTNKKESIVLLHALYALKGDSGDLVQDPVSLRHPAEDIFHSLGWLRTSEVSKWSTRDPELPQGFVFI